MKNPGDRVAKKGVSGVISFHRKKSRSLSPTPTRKKKKHRQHLSSPKHGIPNKGPIEFRRHSSYQSVLSEGDEKIQQRFGSTGSPDDFSPSEYLHFEDDNSNQNANNNVPAMPSDSSVSDDDASTGTQKSEYNLIDVKAGASNRLTCYAFKRKSGFRGKLKKKYALATERSKNFNEFWKGVGKGANNFFWAGNDDNGNKNDDNNASSNGANNESSAPVKMWERRRLVLEGRLLMYYHEDAPLEEEDVSPKASQSQKHALGIQTLKNKFNEFAEHAHFKSPSQAAIKAPRGVVDIVASNATASIVPISSHSYAPTPYCLAIMTKTETKWTFCFDSEKEVVRWLSVFTNLALMQSMERFEKSHGKQNKFSQLGKEDRVFARSMDMDDSKDRSHRSDDYVDEVPNLSLSRRDEKGFTASSRSISTKSRVLLDDAHRVVALVNMAFFYLFLMLEKILWTHVSAFVAINLLTLLHLKESSALRDSPEMREISNDGRNKPSEDSHASDTDILLNTSIDVDRPIMLSSSSFVERRANDEDDEDDSYRPLAGATTVQINNYTDEPVNEDNVPMVPWLRANPNIIQVRGPDYLTSKRKIPSQTSLYELIHVDVFDSDEHIIDLGQRFEMPQHDFGEKGQWSAPDTLIISFALPTTAPKLGRSESDGKGYIVCGFYRIRSKVRKILEIVSNVSYDDSTREKMFEDLLPDGSHKNVVNGVKLWEKWVVTAGTDPEMQKRLKFVPRGENLKELGVPSWIRRYNGKPMLIKRPGETSFVFSHPDKSVLEIDINLHPFPFMFKQAMTYLKDNYFARMLMTFGFVIEGREVDELPEVLLGNPLQLANVNTALVMKSDAVFSERN